MRSPGPPEGDGSATASAVTAAATVGHGRRRASPAQTEAVREQRLVRRVADVDRDLRHLARPRARELAGRFHRAAEHVGDARALGAGQPGGARSRWRRRRGRPGSAAGPTSSTTTIGLPVRLAASISARSSSRAPAVGAIAARPRRRDPRRRRPPPRRRCSAPAPSLEKSTRPAPTTSVEPLADRRARRDGAAPAAPADRPAAALHAHVVGAKAAQVNARRAGQRQHVLVVLQHHQALLNCLARHRAVLRRADPRRQRAVGERPLPQLEADLLLQDPPDGVVDARHRHAPGGDQLLEVGRRTRGSGSAPSPCRCRR